MVTEAILKKGAPVTLVGEKGKQYLFTLNKSVSCNDDIVLDKVKRLNDQVPNKFEINQDVAPELLPPNWKELSDNRLRTVAERFGVPDAKDTKKYRTKKSVIDVIERMITDGEVGVMEAKE